MGTFSRRLTPEVEQQRIYSQAVDKIWRQFDVDNSGALDKAETKRFLETVLADCPPPNNYEESRFEETFTLIDTNKNGLIEKGEMVAFI